MKALFLFLLGFFTVISPLALSGQTVLWSEDFNACATPEAWTVSINGNPSPTWYVGLPTNANSDGSSIDGSCMLVIDDDATGENTPPFDIEFLSPVFDGTAFPSVYVDMDVHFRNYNATDSLQILVFDGQTYHPLKTFQDWDDHTGEQFSQYRSFRFDLSFFASATMQLAIRYADGGEWSWWAGVDNIVVTGEGVGQNVLLETFNDCTLPAGWDSQILTGDHPWRFGTLVNANANATTMNGSCFLYFDDDGITGDTPPSLVRLLSPEFDGSSGVDMRLYFDLIFRRWEDNELFTVGVLDVERNTYQAVTTYQQDVGGPQMDNFVNQEINLSAFRSKRMRLVFTYDDNATFGWWIGIDNVKLVAAGESNELCTKALPLVIGTTDCLPADNTLAIFDGPQPDCGQANVGSLWYRVTTEQAGWLRLQTRAAFNDVLTIFPDQCDNLQPIVCYNRDEHGFEGETYYAPVQASQSYLLRLSGNQGTFGKNRGALCLTLDAVTGAPAPPANAPCANALTLELDGDCLEGGNHWAPLPDPQPWRNALARSGVWYRFTTPTADDVVIETRANFADGIAVFTGACGSLQPLATNEYGAFLTIENPIPGQTYYVLVTGTFATIEGDMCVSVRRVPTTPPANDLCQTAIPLPMTGECVYASNHQADFDGPAIGCVPFLGASVWFSFVAPTSGHVQLLSDADFVQALSIYEGNCGTLSERQCFVNPLACDGYLNITSLSPGQTYFVRLSAVANANGSFTTGNTCIQVRDGQNMPNLQPLQLEVGYQCYTNGAAVLDVSASGGDGSYFLSGDAPGALLNDGDTYLVIVQDGRGCERSVSGTVRCDNSAGCALQLAATNIQAASCADTNDGSATIVATNGTEAYTYAWPNGQTTATATNLQPGNYNVTVSDGAGCVGVVQVSIPSTPAIVLDIEEVVPATGGGTNGAIRFSVSGGTGTLVATVYQNGSPLPDANPEALGAGDYQIQVVDSQGCSFLSGIITVTAITSVADADGEQFRVAASPNPTQGLVQLDWHLPAQADIRLYDAKGRHLRNIGTVAPRMQRYTIDLSQLPSGLYLIYWEANGRVWTQRVLKV